MSPGPKGTCSVHLLLPVVSQEDLILPHHHTFYELIINKARGKSGPLFDFGVNLDIRIMHDATQENQDVHAGKVGSGYACGDIEMLLGVAAIETCIQWTALAGWAKPNEQPQCRRLRQFVADRLHARVLRTGRLACIHTAAVSYKELAGMLLYVPAVSSLFGGGIPITFPTRTGFLSVLLTWPGIHCFATIVSRLLSGIGTSATNTSFLPADGRYLTPRRTMATSTPSKDDHSSIIVIHAFYILVSRPLDDGTCQLAAALFDWVCEAPYIPGVGCSYEPSQPAWLALLWVHEAVLGVTAQHLVQRCTCVDCVVMLCHCLLHVVILTAAPPSTTAATVTVTVEHPVPARGHWASISLRAEELKTSVSATHNVVQHTASLLAF